MFGYRWIKLIVSAAMRAIGQETLTMKGEAEVDFSDAEKLIQLTSRRNAEQATRILLRKLKSRVSYPYPPASKPGSSPHKRTGRGRQAISMIVSKSRDGSTGTIYVKNSGFYMVLLENGFVGKFGTVLPRPWAAPVWAKNKAKLLALLAKGY